MNAEEITLNVSGVKSLVWEGETLVDWVGGGKRIGLNGDVNRATVHDDYDFDAVAVSRSGRFVALYKKLATKALVLEHGKVLRELNRNSHDADLYEYPLTFLTLPDGNEAIAHCPQSYDRIDIEDAASGRCLTDHVPRDPKDIFHSRLNISPGGTWLLSAGWIWHPVDVACLWSMENVLADPRVLDAPVLTPSTKSDVQGVAFLDENRLVLAEGDQYEDEEYNQTKMLSLHHLPSGHVLGQIDLTSSAGTIHAFGTDLVLALHDHPKLISLSVGSILWEWPHLKTGRQQSSIIHHLDPIPPFAKHPTLPLFAVADADKVTVVRGH